jgi:hypothetical protein
MNPHNIQYKPIELSNIGVIQFKVPDVIMSAVNTEVDHIQKNFNDHTPVNSYLAGNIEREYALNQCRSVLDPFVLEMAALYQQRHEIKNQDSAHSSSLQLDGVWCNFQKATEFNPNHNHSGLLSFVIWVRMPYDINEEHQQSPGRNSNKNTAGCFELTYINTIGDLTSAVFPADRAWQGQMLMFPAKMNHCVYPFYTSKDYRISVSGNVSAVLK